MNIEIIPVAIKKLKKRNIQQEWVVEAVNGPDQVVDGYGGREVAQKKRIIDEKEYLIRVVYERENDKIFVITAYITSQIGRYWKKEMRDEN